MTQIDRLKISMIALVGLLVVVAACLAQWKLAEISAENREIVQRNKVDVDELKEAFRREVWSGLQQEQRLAELSRGVADFKSDARKKPGRVVLVVPTPAAPISVVIATPRPEPTMMPDTNPKSGGLLNGIFR